MIYTNKIESIARRYNLEPRAVVMAYALAAGCPRGDIYGALFTRGNNAARTTDNADTRAAEFIEQNAGLPVLVQRIKNKTTSRTDAAAAVRAAEEANKTEEEKEREKERANEYASKSYIIAELAKAAAGLRGKERAAVLMQIADLQRMKQEETRTEEERRTFFVPYVSACRVCALMKCYAEVREHNAGGSLLYADKPNQ